MKGNYIYNTACIEYRISEVQINKKLTNKYRNKKETSHGFDLSLMFQSTSVLGEELIITDWTLEDLSLIRLLWKQVSNFVKTGYILVILSNANTIGLQSAFQQSEQFRQ